MISVGDTKQPRRMGWDINVPQVQRTKMYGMRAARKHRHPVVLLYTRLLRIDAR